MPKQSQNLKQIERQLLAQKGKNLTQGAGIAIRWLKSGIIEPKAFAGKLMVGERQIYKWLNEEVHLPKERVEQILTIARLYMIPLSRLRDETDLFLEAMNDPGIY